MGINPLQVVALKMGELYVDKSTLTYAKDFGKMITIPIWAAAIIGAEAKIVVDTGIHDRNWVNEHVDPCQQQEDEKMAVALKKATGWDPEEVDIVINTHLHYDHVGNNRIFKNAVFYVQQLEWEYAFHPLKSQEWIYNDTRFLYDQRGVDFFAWRFVNGYADVVPGVKLIPTPGHTPGHQSVLVKTAEGVVCVSGDVVNLVENINEDRPVGIVTDVGANFESFARIRQYADYILAGHDPGIQKFQREHFPAIKK
ncbi:N-acyl homoserine lactonase family protein [Neomoorella thermoacetica]|uniref:N-acyl homoserine lactonase n=2 Tax=Neomoorella thermoacetica TaxID=1525 RepID=A0A1D7XAR2_NEOTH|nr:N-acyl homoserine lactonase family protein [Moorella thermoacetica]AKX94031.1 N-acyl homoserine lactonase [Moorella thermoacetica]AKX96670.1 N-acyl homoserine lactonase [Moorella thermoacetica]AOQ23982.1 N-acyl homoserine lactonase [Moorella thermoacetica]APC08423.1 N-acyl homoserine lactonase [Moorella thermoacetica]OIQ12934.1 N-acyl homoserine lactonase [Moorella thermoacetica]